MLPSYAPAFAATHFRKSYKKPHFIQNTRSSQPLGQRKPDNAKTSERTGDFLQDSTVVVLPFRVTRL